MSDLEEAACGNGRRIPAVQELLNEVFSENEPMFDFDVGLDFSETYKKLSVFHAHKMLREEESANAILSAMKDATH